MPSDDRLDATTSAVTIRVTDSPLATTGRHHLIQDESWYLTRLTAGEVEIVLWTPERLRDQHSQVLAAAAAYLANPG